MRLNFPKPSGKYAAELPEAKRKVLYVDTEQSPHHCLNVMERIMRMAGLPDDRDNENLEFLALRKYTPEQRIRIVEQATAPANRHASYRN